MSKESNGRYFKILGRRRADAHTNMAREELTRVVTIAEFFACDAKAALRKAKGESYINSKYHADLLIARAV